MSKKPEILQQHIVAQSRLFTVEALDMRFSNGVERTYERLVPGGHGAVMMVPITEDGHILLIKEYGAGVEDYTLTLPKGAIDLGEEMMDAANRELKEEIGFGARQLDHLKKMSLSPSYMKSGIDVIIAQDLYPESLPGDEPEPLEVVSWPMDRIFELVMRGDMTEGRAIAALYLAQDWLSQPARQLNGSH